MQARWRPVICEQLSKETLHFNFLVEPPGPAGEPERCLGCIKGLMYMSAGNGNSRGTVSEISTMSAERPSEGQMCQHRHLPVATPRPHRVVEEMRRAPNHAETELRKDVVEEGKIHIYICLYIYIQIYMQL